MKKIWIVPAAVVLASVVTVSFTYRETKSEETSITQETPENEEATEEMAAPDVDGTEDALDENGDALSSEEVSDESGRVDASQPVTRGARIAVVSKCTKGEFWNKIQEGMEAALQDVNDAYGFSKDDKLTMTFEGPKDEKDVETQINTLDAVVAENPNVLCMSASDMESCTAQLESAHENGIPVVVFDSMLEDMNLVSAYRSTDNYNAGATAAEKMAEALNGSGNVVIFSAQEKSSTVRDRIRGFQDTIKSHDGITITDILYEDQVEDINASISEYMEQTDNLAGVYCTNYVVAEAYLAVAPEENAPVLIGTDGSSAQIDAIRDGREYGTVSQNPYEMGYTTMLTAVDLLKLPGTVSIEQEELLPVAWLDASNVEDEANSAYRY
ncbi:MAG: substrate-binding domain-containing protein [Eubacteriales bacterium]|nr:substrate-binding domain-containing protein [Eubacteriales bacterium]